MGRYGDPDYVFLAKTGFLLGPGLLVIGAGGELIGHAYLGSLPPWEDTLFFDLGAIGPLIGFFSPLPFGIFLSLTE